MRKAQRLSIKVIAQPGKELVNRPFDTGLGELGQLVSSVHAAHGSCSKGSAIGMAKHQAYRLDCNVAKPGIFKKPSNLVRVRQAADRAYGRPGLRTHMLVQRCRLRLEQWIDGQFLL